MEVANQTNIVAQTNAATQTNLKSIQDAQRYTVQERTREDPQPQYGTGLLYWLSGSGEYVAPWWSPTRDLDLESFWKNSDHLSSAIFTLQARLTSIPMWVEPRDVTLKKYIRQADEFTRKLVEDSDFGKGWVATFGQFAQALWSSDNGAFMEIIGPGAKDRPLTGQPTSLAILDQHRCSRTNNPQWPVIYRDTSGKYYKFHHTRIAYASQMPSTISEMNSVGFCSISRCINSAQCLIDMLRYRQEKLGSRPLRAIMYTPGINAATVENALQLAALTMDSQNLSRFSKIPMVGDIPTDASIELLDLASLPDGFNEEMSTQLGMFTIAMAFGVPIRWLWPAAVIGATKADAMYQHIAGLGSFAQVLTTMKYLLGGSDRGSHHMQGKFLPPHLKLVFDFQDDEQDKRRAEIQERRAKTRMVNLDTNVTNIRVERENALADGDISRPQFVQLELTDGRLEDGTDAIALFFTEDAAIKSFLDLGIENPTNVNLYDPDMVIELIDAKIPEAQAYILQTGNSKDIARLALAALNRLRMLYLLRKDEIKPEEEPEDDAEDDEATKPNTKPDTKPNTDHAPIASEQVQASKLLNDQGKVVARGDPLPIADDVIVESGDIVSAIDDWRSRAPDSLTRILEAIPE